MYKNILSYFVLYLYHSIYITTFCFACSNGYFYITYGALISNLCYILVVYHYEMKKKERKKVGFNILIFHYSISQNFFKEKFLTCRELGDFLWHLCCVLSYVSFAFWLWGDSKLYDYTNATQTKQEFNFINVVDLRHSMSSKYQV